MRPFARLIVTWLLGIAVYVMAVIVAGGYLAAIAVPQAYFGYFGRERAGLALALLTLATWALPVGLIVFGAARLVLRIGRHHARGLAAALLLGMLCADFALRFAAALHLSGMAEAGERPLASAFFDTLLPPWWVLPNVVAPWVGLALAVYSARRAT